MKNKILIVIVVLILIGAAAYCITYQKKDAGGASTAVPSQPAKKSAQNIPPFDPKNATYHDIDDMTVTLSNGSAETEAAPGSASTITTEYFGNQASGDLNGDGLSDTAFLLTQYGSGTGVFYYAVAALGTAHSYKVTNAVFIGDRIAPQTTEIRDSTLIVNYATRKPGEPLTEEPSVGATMRLKLSAAGWLTEIEN